MDLGGGEYDRSRSFDTSVNTVIEVANTDADKFASVDAAYQGLGASGGAVEILDSSLYLEALRNDRSQRSRYRDSCQRWAPPDSNLSRPADNQRRRKWRCRPSTDFLLEGTGYTLPATWAHCGSGIVRSLPLDADGSVKLDGTPTVTIEAPTTVIEIENCIVGPIRVGPDIVVQLKNCIVDAGSTTNVALADLGWFRPGGHLENRELHRFAGK